MRMGAAAFLARLGRDDGGQRVGHEVRQLQRLHQVGVPDQRPVGDLHVVHLARDALHLLDAFGQRLVGAEDGGVGLHGLLHLQPQLGRGRAPSAWRMSSKRSMAKSIDAAARPARRCPGRPPRRRGSPAARPKTTRSMSEFEPRRFAPCTEAQPASPTAIRPGTMRVGIVLGRVQNLAPVVRGDAAHVVVHGRQNRDRLLRQVHTGEDARRFRDARQAFGQRLGRQVVQVQVDVVLVRARRRGLRGFPSSCSG
jgi:hypothetical protein